MKSLWIEKYRPNKAEDYVFIDQAQKSQVQAWIKEKSIPTLMLTGSPGVGKTTLAKLLFNELDVHEYDIKFINASHHNGVEYIRDTVESFCSTMPFGEYKYILLDEADGLSQAAQATLRGTIEKYSNCARFILTANFPHKIIPALHSRCQGFHIEKLDKVEFTARLAQILLDESVEFDIETLDTIVVSTYPDLRKAIGTCQQNAHGGKLELPKRAIADSKDYRIEMVKLFKQGKFTEARKLICANINYDEYDEIYKFMYQNLGYWAETSDKEDEVIVAIRNGLVKHTSCSDPEINLAATLCELSMIKGN